MHPADLAELGSRIPENLRALEIRKNPMLTFVGPPVSEEDKRELVEQLMRLDANRHVFLVPREYWVETVTTPPPAAGVEVGACSSRSQTCNFRTRSICDSTLKPRATRATT